jgi:hypothetical protein
MYKITQRTFDKAKLYDVRVKVSKNPKKKLDVFMGGIKIASVGDINYWDYPTYLLIDKNYAKERKRLYKLRNHKYINVPQSNGFWTYRLLWQ